MPSDPRIGDAERDAAVQRLGEHFAVGRLDTQELDDRISRALTARTAGDLAALFEDLPPDPHTSVAFLPDRSGRNASMVRRTSTGRTPGQLRRLARTVLPMIVLVVALIAVARLWRVWFVLFVIIPVILGMHRGWRGGR